MPSGGRAQPHTGPASHEPPLMFAGAGDAYGNGIAIPGTAGQQFSRPTAIAKRTNVYGDMKPVAVFDVVPSGQRWDLERLRVGANGTNFLVTVSQPGGISLSTVVDGIPDTPVGWIAVLEANPPLRVMAGEQLAVWFFGGSEGFEVQAQFAIWGL